MEVPIYHLDHALRSKAENTSFDGPLDLILALLSRNKMEIQDIQIALILDQYLAWMDRRKELDLEVASEFVTMAAQLMYIKTRMLLSIHDEEAVSEMEELIASLRERQRHENWKKLQSVTPALAQRYRQGRDYQTRPQETVSPDKTYRYTHAPADLLKAITAVLGRSGERLPDPERAFAGIVGREPYPVSSKSEEILSLLDRSQSVSLRGLFLQSKSRSEMVATFLAVLELCKNHRILLTGAGEDCSVTRTDTEEGA